jgi:xanthine dehydrogenase accessory factor
MESTMSSPDLFELARELTRLGQPHAWITVIAVNGPSSSYVGAQAIVKPDGGMTGWIGGGCVQSAARTAALRAITSATPQRLRLSNTRDSSEAVDVRPMACASNGEVELFIQPAAVAPRLRIYGSTPLVRIAAWLAKEMDFDPLTDDEAEDVDASNLPGDAPDRETYALIATQGDGDELALEAALHSCARAVLVIASPRKSERLRKAMELRGIARDRLDAICAPAGPYIGAVTPNEVALAAIAGLVSLRRGHTNTRGEPQDSVAPVSAQALGYINPVCGAVVDPARALSSLTLRGQTHHFCCQGCRTEFERDPDKYLEIGSHMRVPA